MDYVHASTLSIPPEIAIIQATPLTRSHGIDSILLGTTLKKNDNQQTMIIKGTR